MMGSNFRTRHATTYQGLLPTHHGALRPPGSLLTIENCAVVLVLPRYIYLGIHLILLFFPTPPHHTHSSSIPHNTTTRPTGFGSCPLHRPAPAMSAMSSVASTTGSKLQPAARGGASAAGAMGGPICYGDLISIYVEDKGFLATPAVDDPIPLAPSWQQLQVPPPPHAPASGEGGNDPSPPLSHLRAAKPHGPGSLLPADFHNRCIFEVLSEGGLKAMDEPVTYGSMVQLRHPKTGFTIMVDSLAGGSGVGHSGAAHHHPVVTPFTGMADATGGSSSSNNNNNNANAPRFFTRLRNATTRATETSAQFYLRPRYSVRVEGDLVRDHDRIVLESCRFKGLQLCLKKKTGSEEKVGGGVMLRQASMEELDADGESIVSVSDDAYLNRSGWQIHLISRARSTIPLSMATAAVAQAFPSAAATAGAAGSAPPHEHHHRDGSLSDEGVVIAGGDFVRFAHQEIIGHLIARVDDGAERCSRISPLGMVYRKFQLEKSHTTGVFLRRGATQPSSLSIFQVIPQHTMSGQPIEWDAPVRLRHLLSGQYLALRPLQAKDSASIHASAKAIATAARGFGAGARLPPPPAAGGGGSSGGHQASDSAGEGLVSSSRNNDDGVLSPPASPRPASPRLEMGSSLDLSAGNATLAGSVEPGQTPMTAGGEGVPLSSTRMVVATTDDPEDTATLFRFHSVRDADTTFVTSKSKCLLVHHDTGAHLSLGRSLIAQHGKSGLRAERPASAAGGGGGLSFASVAMAARMARKQRGEEDGDGGSRASAGWGSYWEYDNDSLVCASCEDNSDAEVYRIYPVKQASTRHVLYALRYQPVLADAVEVVRAIRLDATATCEQAHDTSGMVLDNSGFDGRRSTRIATSIKTSSLRLSRALTHPDEHYLDMCQYLLYALNELILWQAGEIDADGEIQRREGVPLFAEDGMGRKNTGYSCSTKTTGAGAASTSRSGKTMMEKDEDSFDRDLAWRRRELLRDCHLVEALLMFISVSFQLYRGRTYARGRTELLGSTPSGEIMDPHLLCPDTLPVIDACCKSAYRLLREIMTPNCARTVLYLAGINSMVRHISLGWDPPIEEILAAAIDQQDASLRTSAPSSSSSSGQSSASSLADATTNNSWKQYRLSHSDLYQLVLELYGSYMHKEITGTKILKLLANVCAPGNVVDPKVQSFLASLILQTKRKASGSSLGPGTDTDTFTLDELNVVPDVTSLLFSLRPGGAQGGWRVHLSLMQEKPVYVPDTQEMTQFSEAERGIIREAFNRYDEDGNGAIDREELGLLLQDLGLQSLIVEEVQSRWDESCSFDAFCSWWHQHRHILETWSSPFDYSQPAAGDDKGAAAAAGGGGSGGGGTPKSRTAAPVPFPPPVSAPSVHKEGSALTIPPALHIATPHTGTSSQPQLFATPSSGPPPPTSSQPATPLSSLLLKKRRRALPPRSITIEDDIEEAELFAIPDAIFQRWIELELLFTHERFTAEAKWIRASVRLLVALCRDRNLVSQRLVGTIVPVDAVLYLLHSNALGKQDKALFCDLLRTCYVEHDLVFPVAPLLPKQAVCLSLDPEAVAHGEMGRVFNPLSQVTLSLASLSSNPTDQRAGLRAFLKEHFAHLEEYVSQRDGKTAAALETFATALLRLTHALVLQGFFETDPKSLQQHQQQRSGWPAAGGMDAGNLTVGAGSGLLTAFFGQQQHPEHRYQGKTSEWGSPVARTSMAKGEAAEGESVPSLARRRTPTPTGGLLARLTGTPRKQRPALQVTPTAAGAAHNLTYSFLETSLILTLEVAGAAAADRLQATKDGLEDLQMGYNALFDELGPITLKTEILELLRVLCDIRSIKNMKSLLWSLNAQAGLSSGGGGVGGGGASSAAAAAASAAAGDAEFAGANRLAQLRFTKAQEAVLERGFDDRTVDGELLMDAVVGTTAHRDKNLLVKAFDLLYHHSIQRVTFAALLEEVEVARRPSLAITMRVQRVVMELFEKHMPGFQQHKSKGTCDVLSYALHLLQRLCYRNWNDQVPQLVGATATHASMAHTPHASGFRPPPRRSYNHGAADLEGLFPSPDGRGYQSLKVPFVVSEGLGLDDLCAQPVPTQQKVLQWAVRRVASFVVRVLETEPPPEALKKSHRLGASTANPSSSGGGDLGNSFQTPTLDGGGPSSLRPSKPSSTSNKNSLSTEQRRVVNECFAFLYHACRNQEDLVRAVAVPHLKTLWAHALEFPYAMRMLAALARLSLKATRLKLADVTLVLDTCFSPSSSSPAEAVPESMRTESLGLLRAILKSTLKDDPDSLYMDEDMDQETEIKSLGDQSPQLLLKAAVLTAVCARCLEGSADGQPPLSLATVLGTNEKEETSGKPWAFRAESLGLVCACLEATKELETSGEGVGGLLSPSPSSSSSRQDGSSSLSGSGIKLDVLQGVKDRVAHLFPVADSLQAALDGQLPLPIRSLLLTLVRLQAFDTSSSSSSPAQSPAGLDLRPSLTSSMASATSLGLPLPPPSSSSSPSSAQSTKASFELMQTFATHTQSDLDGLRRSIVAGAVNLKALEGMAALPYLFKTIPAFLMAFLRDQGYNHALEDALQAGLDRAKRKIEKEQTRSRLWKATENLLSQKVAKALLMDRAEEVMTWLLETFEPPHSRRSHAHHPSSHQHEERGSMAGGGLLAALQRVGSSPGVGSPAASLSPASKQSSRSSVHHHHHHRGGSPPHPQQQEHNGPPPLQRKVLGQLLALIDRLATVVLRTPELQAQWAASYDPWAQSLLTLLAFAVIADRVHQMMSTPSSASGAVGAGAARNAVGPNVVAATMNKALSGLSAAATGLVAGPGGSHVFPPRKTTLDNSVAGSTVTAATFLQQATMGADPSSLGGGQESRFIVHLTQALEARRAVGRTTAEDEEVIGAQIPAMLQEARSYVLNMYEPRKPVDDEYANQCHHLASVGWKGSKQWVSEKLGVVLGTEDDLAVTVRGSLSQYPPQHPHRHHAVALVAAEQRVVGYPPSVAASESLIRRVLWQRFESYMEFYFDDAPHEEEEEEMGGGGGGGGHGYHHPHHHAHHPFMSQESLEERAAATTWAGHRSFRTWSKAGGLFIEHMLIMIRYRIWEEDDCCLFFLDVLTRFLEDDLARIRREGASRVDTQKLIKLVQTEVASQQKKQLALQALDGHIVLMAIVAQAAQPGLVASKAPALLKIMPRVLRYGTRLMATGNRQVQETVMDYYDKAVLEVLVQRKFCVGLRNMLRFCRYQVETLMYSANVAMGVDQADPGQMEDLIRGSQPTQELAASLFDFLGSLCAGHNMRARTFLREQRLSGDTVNLVAECASLVFTLSSYTLSLMTYVGNRNFTTKVAPLVHPTQAKKTRRFIAWHQNPGKFAHLTDLLRVLGQGFNSLTEMVQGPCRENQVICERLCTFVGEILEYTGTIHLELPSQRNHSRLWSGGDPLKFYELYVKEMSRLGSGGGGGAGSNAASAPPPPGRPISMAAPSVASTTASTHQQQQQDLEELEMLQILDNLRLWRRVGERKMFSFHLHLTKALQTFQPRPRETTAADAGAPSRVNSTGHPGGAMSSKDILGVDLHDFTTSCLGAEKSCLKFLTAMLEGQNPGVVEHVRTSIDSFVLFQNMDSLTRGTATATSGSGHGAASFLGSTVAGAASSSKGSLPVSSAAASSSLHEAQRRQEKQEAAVLYLTILSTLASLSRTGGGDQALKGLEEWQATFAKQGTDGSTTGINTLVASVEIVGLDGQLQQVFFAPPAWIKQYWQYPLVQKAKKELAYQVNRDSPEEKILDFYDRMTVLRKVMKRQEDLHKVFSIFHGFVGGKSVDSRWLPSPRAILLVLTLLLNVYLCTRLYYQDMPDAPSPIWASFMAWRSTPNLIKAVKICHFGLCLSLLFTAGLNSGAGDAVRGHAVCLPGGRHVLSYDWLLRLYVILRDVRWLLLMSVLSAVGLWTWEIAYAFCVVDVIPQIRLMKFLLEAITRNSHKITLTVLLCMVVLYVFSTVSCKCIHPSTDSRTHPPTHPPTHPLPRPFFPQPVRFRKL